MNDSVIVATWGDKASPQHNFPEQRTKERKGQRQQEAGDRGTRAAREITMELLLELRVLGLVKREVC